MHFIHHTLKNVPAPTVAMLIEGSDVDVVGAGSIIDCCNGSAVGESTVSPDVATNECDDV